MLLGLIAEACKTSFSSNLDEAMKTACAGLVDGHMRVRYGGLSATALLLTELAPKAQRKYHTELVPKLLAMMMQEEKLKMKT